MHILYILYILYKCIYYIYIIYKYGFDWDLDGDRQRILWVDFPLAV